jgi:hypothetical protein
VHTLSIIDVATGTTLKSFEGAENPLTLTFGERREVEAVYAAHFGLECAPETLIIHRGRGETIEVDSCTFDRVWEGELSHSIREGKVSREVAADRRAVRFIVRSVYAA